MKKMISHRAGIHARTVRKLQRLGGERKASVGSQPDIDALLQQGVLLGSHRTSSDTHFDLRSHPCCGYHVCACKKESTMQWSPTPLDQAVGRASRDAAMVDMYTWTVARYATEITERKVRTSRGSNSCFFVEVYDGTYWQLAVTAHTNVRAPEAHSVRATIQGCVDRALLKREARSPAALDDRLTPQEVIDKAKALGLEPVIHELPRQSDPFWPEVKGARPRVGQTVEAECAKNDMISHSTAVYRPVWGLGCQDGVGMRWITGFGWVNRDVSTGGWLKAYQQEPSLISRSWIRCSDHIEPNGSSAEKTK